MPAIRLGSGEGLSNLTLGVERGPELLLRSSDLRTRDSPPPPPPPPALGERTIPGPGDT